MASAGFLCTCVLSVMVILAMYKPRQCNGKEKKKSAESQNTEQ